ncbi:MAG: hypothetical protein J6Y94_02910, partial [Bacteriovoracaceae bacterium]|nr:hypothetical protein [Bacteriovoracaceae bacterium]
YRLGKAVISLVLLNQVMSKISNVKLLLFICLALWPILLVWIFREQRRMVQHASSSLGPAAAAEK